MLDVAWGIGIESDQLCFGSRELSGVGCRVVFGSRPWESLVIEVGKHFLTYAVRALLAECLVLLGYPKWNHHYIQKVFILLEIQPFWIKEQIWTVPGKGKVTFPVMRSTSFSVGSERGMAAAGAREGCSAFQTLPNPQDGLQNQRLCVDFECCLLEAVRLFPSFWVHNSHTLSKIAGPNGYWEHTDLGYTPGPGFCDSLEQNNEWRVLFSSPTKW